MKTYFIADLHFGHSNIIKYCNRPFAAVEEMDESMIHTWNSIVKDDDIVYVLGDWSFYNFEKTKEITNQLKGRKFLIMGNHDHFSIDKYREIGFEKVYDKPIFINDFWVASHEPLAWVNENMPIGNIFGHVHNNPMYAPYSKNHFCVSVELINYTPISFNEITKTIKNRYEEKII